MIKLVQNADFSEQEERTRKRDAYPCIICGRRVKNVKHMLHIHDGGDVIVTEQEAKERDGAGDMGMYPIGPDCLNLHPELKLYAVKQENQGEAKQEQEKHFCINHKRREGVYSFAYRSNGQPKQSYYCEECAASRSYEVFRQPLQRVG